MSPADQQVSLLRVLNQFHHDELYLFLAAAITTVGLLAAAFSLLRRRFDPLLLWFALFAVLYSTRLWLTHRLLALPGQNTAVIERVRASITFLIPIPAFIFIQHLGFITPVIRPLTLVIAPLAVLLTLITLVIGPRPELYNLNDAAVVVALLLLVAALLRRRQPSSDFDLIRRGLFVFTASALYENIAAFFFPVRDIETFSFVILLICLGIVAGRRTLAQESQLTAIRQELEIAQRIQRSILPADFPPSAHFQVAARYVPMTAVAGDFYDFLAGDDQQAGILIADVSGHGVPAALIASMVKLAASSQRNNATCPSDLLNAINATLCGNTQTQFVTAAYVYLHAPSRELRYAAAAHPPMLLLRDGEVSEIEENGLMLAAFPFATYSTVSRPLEPGDRLLLYTDGVLEATDSKAEEFGQERLTYLLRQTASLSGAETADQIVAKVQHWSATQNDDLTVIVCDYIA